MPAANPRSLTRLLVPLLFFGIAAGAANASIPVILSTDVGTEIDDQWAITYLLANPDFDVLGIISAHSPGLPDPAAHNSYLILRNVVETHLGLKTHPPLFEGSSLPLESATTPRPGDAVDFIIESSRPYSASHRLTLVTIGAATDVASAILVDPTIADRVRIVAMAFNNNKGGNEWNVANDVAAWQALLASHVPIVIGPGDTCRADLSLNFDQAKSLISQHGPIGAWLWDEYRFYYFAHVKPARSRDFTKPWMIWDLITLSYLEGMTQQQSEPRPQLNSDMSFSHPQTKDTIQWIAHVDSQRLWQDLTRKLDAFQRTHEIQYSGFIN